MKVSDQSKRISLAIQSTLSFSFKIFLQIMGEEIGVDVGVYNQARANVFMRGNKSSILIFLYYDVVFRNYNYHRLKQFHIFGLGREIQELLTAAEIGNLEKLRYIVNAVEEFEMENHWMTQGDKKGRTTLHHAAIYGYMNVVTFIVNEVINVLEKEEEKQDLLNVPDYKGRTPLFHAAVEKRLEVVQFLVEEGASMESVTNEKHIEPGSTVLMACAEKKSKRCFQYLLENGADISKTRDDGADALYIASRYGHAEIIELIIENCKLVKRDISELVNRPTFRGRTALLTAAHHGHIQVCKQLFKNGADLNHQDDHKFTALIYASNQGHFDVVKWLVENGANVHLKDNFGENALKCALTQGYTEIIRFLQRLSEPTEEEEEEKAKGKSKRKGSGRKSTGTLVTVKILANNNKRMSR